MSESKAKTDRHANGTLSFHVSDELRSKIEERQHAKGMRTLSDSARDLIKQALSTNTEILNLQKCKKRSEIPAHYGKFVRCLEYGRVITEQECRDCETYNIVKLPLMTMEKYGEVNRKLREEIAELRKEKKTLLVEAGQLDFNTQRGLLKTIHEKDMDLSIMQGLLREKTETCTQLETDKTLLIASYQKIREELYKTSTMKPTEEVRAMPQKVEPNPPITERITEKVTEKFAVVQQPLQPLKTPSPSELLLCPKTAKMVSIDEACKKCDGIADCAQYGEYVYLRPIKKQ